MDQVFENLQTYKPEKLQEHCETTLSKIESGQIEDIN